LRAERLKEVVIANLKRDRYTPNNPASVRLHNVLLEQLRSLWKKYPTMRLGQLLIVVSGRGPNPFFNVEDHVLSERICAVRDGAGWPPMDVFAARDSRQKTTEAEPGP
jgi:hypothetical protein